MDVDWYESPLPFEGVENRDVNRLLNYLMRSRGAAAHVRRVATRHSFPCMSEDFVLDVQVRAVENAKRSYRDVLSDTGRVLFVDAGHVAAKGNGFLQNAFYQIRAGWTGPPVVPVGIEPPSPEEHDGAEHDDDLPRLEDADHRAVRTRITHLAATGQIACLRDDAISDQRCWHNFTACPDSGVVLCIALQLVALAEGARPPRAHATHGDTLSARDLKYAIVSSAAPWRVDPERQPVPAAARQAVRRWCHCAENLVMAARVR